MAKYRIEQKPPIPNINGSYRDSWDIEASTATEALEKVRLWYKHLPADRFYVNYRYPV